MLVGIQRHRVDIPQLTGVLQNVGYVGDNVFDQEYGDGHLGVGRKATHYNHGGDVLQIKSILMVYSINARMTTNRTAVPPWQKVG